MSRVNCFYLMKTEEGSKIVAAGGINEQTIKENGRILNECEVCGEKSELFLKNFPYHEDGCGVSWFIRIRCPHCRVLKDVYMDRASKDVYKAIEKAYEKVC